MLVLVLSSYIVSFLTKIMLKGCPRAYNTLLILKFFLTSLTNIKSLTLLRP